MIYIKKSVSTLGGKAIHTLACVVGIRKAGVPAFLMFSLWVDSSALVPAAGFCRR